MPISNPPKVATDQKAKPGAKANPPGPKPAAAKTAAAQAGPAQSEATFPPPLLLQGDTATDLAALRALLAAAGLRDLGEVLNDKINQPANFYRFVYEQTAKRPRFIHPDHHPRLLPDYLTAQASADPSGRALILLPAPRLAAASATASVIAGFHRLVQQGRAHLLHISTANTLRLLASRTPAQPLPLGRLLPQLRAQARLAQQRKAAFAQHPEAVDIDISQLCTAKGQLTDQTRARLGALLGPTALPVGTTLNLPPRPPLAHLLPNLDAIRAQLQNTPFAWMAEDRALPPDPQG